MNITEEIERAKQIIEQHEASIQVSKDTIAFHKKKLKKLERLEIEAKEILAPAPVEQ